MKIYLKLVLFFSLTLISIASHAQNKNTPHIIGRVIIDGGIFLNQRDTLNSGINFTDLRIGMRGTIEDNWFYKIDIGYTFNQVSAKDVYFGYTKGAHQIMLGHFFEPYSMDILPSSVFMRFQQTASIVTALGNPRKIGITYMYNVPKFHFTGGVFSDNSVNGLNSFSKSYSFNSRFIYRPIYTKKDLIHISLSPSWKKLDGKFSMTSTGVSIIDEKPISYVSFTDAKSQFRLGAEYYMQFNRLSVKTEYMFTNVFSSNNTYLAHGGYLELAYIPLGSLIEYDSVWGCLDGPTSQSLEIVLRYAYQNLDDNKAKVYGGEFHDITLGINYYINKHFGFKINYSYLMPLNHCINIHNSPVSLIQLRAHFVI